MKFKEILKSILLEAEYACFNRRRSLRHESEGEPSVHMESDCIQVKDPSAPDDTYVNRLIVPYPVDVESLVKIMQQYAAQGLAHSIDVLPHALDPKLSSKLLEAGFIPVRELLFLQLRPGGILHEPAPGITIKRISPGEGRLFLDAVIASIGQEIAPAIVASKSHFYEDRPFLCYLAYLGEELAGLATLYLAEDRAWMANAFTFKDFRGRGVQSALIQRRIQDAAAFGVKTLLSDVEFLSPSFRNLQRLGFQFHYAATSWERLGT